VVKNRILVQRRLQFVRANQPAPFSTSTVTLDVNGQRHRLEVRHHWTLLDVLRDQLELTGAKRGCDRGECGSCTVLVGGQPVYACQLLVMQVGEQPILTIEGLAQGNRLDSVQQAFLENDGGQCGFCTPGFVMAARALLNTNPNPTDDEIRQALSGNLCRCNAYGRIIQSVRAAQR
jgi:aerobic-type carbon monoxide dehydrogenase small subunit (CoxS/CutS family)